MNKVIKFVPAMIALALAGCSQSSDLTGEDQANTNKQEVKIPVNMTTYQARANVQGRAGTAGSINSVADLVNKGGFGVFAYQTGSKDYSAAQTEFFPDFMYDQLVSGKASSDGSYTWDYTPKKFWPNDNTVADNSTNNATGVRNTGKVSFFAYAPYVATSDATKGTVEDETSGITGFSANGTNGDPTVSYTLPSDGNVVDLLWGTAGSNGTTTNGTPQTGKTLTGGNDAVNVDLTKMKTNGKIQFVFKHALAKLGGKAASDAGGLLIKADPDIKDQLGKNGPTKITVTDITITTDNGSTKQSLVNSGTFNLATGVWKLGTATEGTVKTEITNSSDNGDAVLAEAIAEPATVSSFDNLPAGVTETSLNVYKEETNPMIFIPGSTLPKLYVTITYTVRTEDQNVLNGFTTTVNKISKEIDFTSKQVELNKRYTLTLILGLTSVKFEATVSDWEKAESGTDTKTVDNTDVYLPINVKDA
ncbi:MAG: hypothetical protein PUD15_08500 [Prevotella sp.]|nr:hypothetical protein [Prevotella sp.]